MGKIVEFENGFKFSINNNFFFEKISKRYLLIVLLYKFIFQISLRLCFSNE